MPASRNHIKTGLRAVIIGCGSIGQRHARNLASHPEVETIAVDPDPGRRAAVEALGLRAFPDIGAVTEADAALICTPAPDHVPQALAMLERGWDVFIEKPVATTADEARSLSIADFRDQIVAVGYNLRFEPALLRLNQALESLAIGRALSAHIEFGQYLPDWRPARDYRDTVTARASSGGGILLEGSHELDLARWLFGEWTTVASVVRKQSDLDIDVEDTVAAVIEFRNGPIVELHLDMLRRGYERRVECIGQKGTLEWRLRSGTRRVDPDGSSEVLAGPCDVNEMYVAELESFINCVRSRRKPVVGLNDGIQALALVEAIRRASAEGARVTAAP